MNSREIAAHLRAIADLLETEDINKEETGEIPEKDESKKAGVRLEEKESNKAKAESETKPKTEEKPKYTKADVRKVLARKADENKDVRSLLRKYGAGKLSEVKEEDYEKLIKDAEVM